MRKVMFSRSGSLQGKRLTSRGDIVGLKGFMDLRYPVDAKEIACYTQFSSISGASIRA